MSKSKTKMLLELLNNRIDSVRESEEFRKMLQFLGKFHNYSYQNSILIQMQKPDASYVAGYKQWQKKFNRHVKKGEKAISILAPFTYKKKVTVEKKVGAQLKEVEKEVKRIYFRPVNVFDVSQTEGDPLPNLDISVADDYSRLYKPLAQFTKFKDITLTLKVLSESLKGYSRGGKIVINKILNQTERSGVLVHELGHELLHQKCGSELSKEVKEMEAEAAAFVVMDHYGVDIKSDKYLALYKESYDLKQSLKRIDNLASEIINYCDDYLIKNKENDKKLKEVI
jgi:Zn-dependent peptidase ImmA (M78 family)